MAQFYHWTLALTLAGSLAAQSLPEALSMVPEDVSVLVVMKDATATDQKFRAFTGRFGKSSSFHEWKTHFGRELGAAGHGPALFVERQGPNQKKVSDLLVAPAGNYRALVKELHAAPSGKLHSFTRGKQTFFLATRAGFALFSKDRALIEEALQTRGGLQASLAPQLQWIQSRDVAGVIPEKAFHKALTEARADMLESEAKTASPTPAAAKEVIKTALEALDASATFFAFSMDLPEDRSFQASAKLFFRAGAPMASWVPKVVSHPLQGVPATPYALAFGGPSAKGAVAWATDVLTPLLYGQAAPEALQSLKAVQSEIHGNIRSAAWQLGVPVAPGRGLLSGSSGVLKVEDPARYMDSMERLARLQADLAAKKPKGEDGAAEPVPVFSRNIIPGAPSASVATPLGGGKASPKSMLFQGLVFGGDSVQVSLAQADDHTLVVVVGGAEALQRALDAYRAPLGTLDQDAGIKAVDALLPAEAPWRLYFNLRGLRDFGNSVLENLPILPGGKGLPKVDSAPPVALALRIDAQGMDLSVAATGSTMDAIAKWGKDMEQLFPKKAQAEATAKP